MTKALNELMAGLLVDATTQPRLLVSHTDDAGLLGALHSCYSNLWQRTAAAQGVPTAWPDSAVQYDEVVLPLPRGKESLHFCLHACASLLKPNGTLWLFGLNELGIKSADKPLSSFFDEIETVATGGHGRVWRASGLKKDSVKTLSQLRQQQLIALPNTQQPMISYPGLFAGGKLDEGTGLLLTVLPDSGEAVLDYACGIGVLACAMQLNNTPAQIALADYDPLALLAAAENVPGAQVILTASPADLTGSYDVIVSNPPIHVGNMQSFVIVDELLAHLPRLLRPKGAAYIVVQVTVPVPRLATTHKLACSEMAASRSFRVYKLSA